jgi:multidrug efflux system outer membrane protein
MNIVRFFIFPVIVLFGLSACGEPSGLGHQDLPLPAHWKNTASFPVAKPTQDLSRWWKRFNDPVLSRIISDALKSSPDMASAVARIRGARASRDIEIGGLFPMLTGSVGGARSGTRNTSTSSNTITSYSSGTGASITSYSKGTNTNVVTSYSAGLNASWEVDLFGAKRNAVKAASAAVGASQENEHSVAAALASEIAIAYTSLRASEAGLEVLRRNVHTQEQTSQLASWRNQAGEADGLESSQALSSLEQARAGIPGLEQNISQSHNLLTLLSGLSPGSLDGILNSGKKGIPIPPRSLAIGIPADTIRQRPDVRIAGYQLLAATANTRIADAARLPSLNLSGSLGLDSLGSAKLFNPQTAAAGFVAGISSPIFDAGIIRANIVVQSAAEEQAYQAYRTTVFTALSETEDALIACRRTAERLAAFEKSAVAAREADKLAHQRYQSGEIDFLTVLDTQRSLLGIESSLFSSRADRTIAYIQLYKALGGGWSAGS